MRYILNSAVITKPGVYKYRVLTESKFAEMLLSRDDWVSRVGYHETKRRIEELTHGKLSPSISRETSPMNVGDEALVIRIRYRVADPSKKRYEKPSPDSWEYGFLVRVD